MKRVLVWLLAGAVGAALFCGCKKTEETGPDVLMTVNGDPIKVGELQRAWSMLSDEDKVAYSGVDGTKKLLDEVVTWKLMAQEAQRRRLDEDPSVKEQIVMSRQRILVGALLDKAVSDADIYRYFQENFIRLRFILVKFPENATGKAKAKAGEKAKAAYDELKGGADFRETAQARSEAGNAADGGEMGYVTHETIQNMAGFQAAEAVFGLKQPGEFTEPVEGGNGWYIFQLVEPSGNLDPRGLGPQLRGALRDRKMDEVVRSYSNELNSRGDNVITRNDEALQYLFDNLKKAIAAQAGNSVEPGSGVEPGSTAQPPAPPKPEPMPGASVKTGDTASGG
ncbi:MAG TPA: peptidylprolyl isomerase [bacterium]|nr:peptidylprolyl isomerase [bacterium]